MVVAVVCVRMDGRASPSRLIALPPASNHHHFCLLSHLNSRSALACYCKNSSSSSLIASGIGIDVICGGISVDCMVLLPWNLPYPFRLVLIHFTSYAPSVASSIDTSVVPHIQPRSPGDDSEDGWATSTWSSGTSPVSDSWCVSFLSAWRYLIWELRAPAAAQSPEASK